MDNQDNLKKKQFTLDRGWKHKERHIDEVNIKKQEQENDQRNTKEDGSD